MNSKEMVMCIKVAISNDIWSIIIITTAIIIGLPSVFVLNYSMTFGNLFHHFGQFLPM